MPFAFHLQHNGSNTGDGSASYQYKPDQLKGDVFQSTDVMCWDGVSLDFTTLKTPTDSLRACVDRFAKLRLVHEDIQWRHVAALPVFKRCGLLRRRWKYAGLRYMFIDLSRVRLVGSEVEARQVMEPAVHRNYSMCVCSNTTG